MVFKKMMFYWQNYFDSAVVTASSEAADFPVEFLQNRWKTINWRSGPTGSAGEWIQAVLTVPRAIQGFILENMNLSVGATVTLTGDGNNIFTIAVTAAMAAAKRIEVTLAAETPLYQTWILSMLDAGNPDGYLSGSRIYLGPIFEPEGQCRGDSNHWPESDSTTNYSDGGQASVTVRPPYEVYDVPIFIIGQTDADGYAAINTKCGKELPLWICFDTTDEIASTIYAQLLEYIAFPMKVSGVLWETSLRFREEL